MVSYPCFYPRIALALPLALTSDGWAHQANSPHGFIKYWRFYQELTILKQRWLTLIAGYWYWKISLHVIWWRMNDVSMTPDMCLFIFHEKSPEVNHNWTCEVKNKSVDRLAEWNLKCNNVVIWSSWCLKSLATWFFVQQLVQNDVKEISKFPVSGLLLGESTCDQWIPLTRGQ